MRQRYGADLDEADAVHAFMNRMRRARGLPEAPAAGGWQEGDYRKFLPDFSAMEPPKDPQRPGRGFYLRNMLVWGGVLSASVLCLRALV